MYVDSLNSIPSQNETNFLEDREFSSKNQFAMQSFAGRVAPFIKTQAAFQNARMALMNNVSVRARAQSNSCGQDKNSKKQNLLRYPAFPLAETICKFMKTVEPILNEQELCQTRQAAENFVKCEGKKLQELLEKSAAKEQNWLASRWQRTAYFQYRDPVTVFSSPGMTFPLTCFKTPDEYLDYTSKLIFAMLKYKEEIDNDKIPIVKMGKFELDNSQFKRVFGTCRIPKPCEDTIEYHPDSKHIVVIYKNNFYKLPIYNEEGKILCPSTIDQELKKIMENKESGMPFGLLSTDNRDNWAESFKELENCPENKSTLEAIKKSLFTVSLDEHVKSERGEELNDQASQLIHGGGSCKNAGNRWMDKTIQLCVNPNGASGFTYEHSPAEGQPISMIVDYVLKNLNCEDFFKDGASSSCDEPSQLIFKSSPKIQEYISKARDNVNKLAEDLHMNILVYEGYGKEFLKQQKLSPDSYVQMAMQYAFYALHGVPAVTYETAHLRIYDGGRTETIRSCSNESVAFAKAMCNKDKNAAELLRKAVDNHRKYTTDALMGRGVDRHLKGLQLMAIENNLPIPEFYKSPGVIKSAHFRLSTSQVASKYKTFMCYGPLTDDGYGCCYNPRDSSIILAISSWRHNKETCSKRFAEALTEALDEMKITLSSQPKSKL